MTLSSVTSTRPRLAKCFTSVNTMGRHYELRLVVPERNTRLRTKATTFFQEPDQSVSVYYIRHSGKSFTLY